MDKVKEIWGELKAKVTGKTVKPEEELVTTIATDYEINLVPDVKMEMIRAQKMRNLVLFICIAVSAVSVGVVLILFGVKSGQDIAMSNQDKRLNLMSTTLMGYEELGDLVTVQAQLDKLDEIAKNKTLPSRVFGALGVMLSQGSDLVQLSELRIDLETNTLRLEGQADARISPLIDYRVLEAFKKSAALTKYDYGRYVDAKGTEIPTWCISESDESGNAYRQGENYYAWWNLTTGGCAAYADTDTIPEGSNVDLYYRDGTEVERGEVELSYDDLTAEGVSVEVDEEGGTKLSDASIEIREIDGQMRYFRTSVTRVKIWRTPLFTEWNNSGLMQLDGEISGIQHFESQCTSYSGTMVNSTNGKPAVAKWISTNECMLVPNGLTVTESSNGRDGSDNLVLKFGARMVFDEGFFLFKNKHMIAIGPMGQNVTDSYVQISNMFTQAARECAADDTECLSNSTNTGGNTQNGGE